MNKLVFIILAVTFLSSGTFAKDKGQELFIKKCSTCHVLQMPSDRSQMVAPPARGIMFHMSEAFNSNKEIKKHITKFTINPTKDKAICNSVRRFGLMPSQKGSISDKELEIVAQWMIDNLGTTKEQYIKNKQRP